MNLPGTTGESSCKRQENGDGTIEPDRPLKKARFAWQVKGKYHLKNENTESKPSNTSKEIDKPSSSNDNNNQRSNLVGNTEQNLEILGDYLLKQDFNTLDSITDAEKILPPSTSNDKIPYPRYISSFESSSQGNRSSSDEDNVQSPMSLVHTNNYTEDQCIARWQARQMAKCFVDNTINRVLDNWMIAPLPTDMDNNRFLALDVAEFINNLPGDNTIENEGILMAISAHGLQNTSSTSSNDNGKNISTNYNKDVTNSPSSSPIPSDDEISPAPSKSIKNNELSSSSDLDMSWSFEEESKQCDNNDLQLTFFPEKSSSYKYYGDNDPLENSGIECDGDETLNGNDDIMDNYDFLDAAVTFAIQNKGLTSFGTDYG
ncbi:uncharacterized protein LOC123698384 [Colias croceus]|uniref:uncharacterized protein LOC123698384 n=1 Tax=Colias crocea TaxID=72248 RepID=UPI001E27DDBC|nr:uncharacterized protein LOC123698384 [Colias croceus]